MKTLLLQQVSRYLGKLNEDWLLDAEGAEILDKIRAELTKTKETP